MVEFAETVLGVPFDPWERWLVIHGGELLPDGRPRFRKLLVIVARQNGKTHVLVVLSLFWLFVERVGLVLGTSTIVEYAKESWQKAVSLAEGSAVLSRLVSSARRANGQVTLTTVDGCRYKIAPANRLGGRSLTVERLVLDELREHQDWSAWSASYNAMNAVPGGQVWAITNMGDEQSVVLNSLRAEVMDQDLDMVRPLDDRDRRLGLFEYSAPPGSSADDPVALAWANPNLGRRIDLDDLLVDARRALRNGGEELATFVTEVLCLRVKVMNPAVSVQAWSAPYDPRDPPGGGCLDPGVLDPAGRARLALVFDVSPDLQHASLYAAATLGDGRVRVDVVEAWSGPQSTARLRRELVGWVAKVGPAQLGWYPSGPAASVAAQMARRPGWPPRGITFAQIKDEAGQVCMGFAEMVVARQVAHSAEPLLDAQIAGAEKLVRGDAWVFTRRGGHVDALYAAAGAIHLARKLPPRRPRLVLARTTAL